MRISRFALILALGASACGGGDSTGPTPTYESVAGSYAGPFAGTSDGVVIDTDISFTLSQNGSALSGTFAITGALSDATSTYEISGTGTITGSIGAGSNPSVNLSAAPAACPNRKSQFSGTYDSPNNRITVLGTVVFVDTSCNVLYQSSATFVLLPS